MFRYFPAIIFLIVYCISGCSNSTRKNEPENLPEIHISGDLNDLNLGDYSKAEITCYSEKGATELKKKIKIRYRGNRSFDYPKKNYSFKLKKGRELFGLNKSKRWKLNAEFVDKTMLRNKISYTLFREFSDSNVAAKIVYVNLYVNKKYKGIYALTESIDQNMLQLGTKTSGAVLFKEPPIFYPSSEHKKRFEDFQNYSLTSVRYNAFSKKARKKLAQNSYFNQRSPSLKQKNYANEIYKITTFIFDSSDEVFTDRPTFNSHFKLENIVDWHLLLLVTNNGDGYYKNFYLSRSKFGEPFLFTPWDYDHSFGRDGDGEPSHEKVLDFKNMRLITRLLETNAFNYRQKLLERFIELKQKNILTVEHLHELIDNNAAVLEKDMDANTKLWPLSTIKYFKTSSFESEVKIMKKWVEEHLPRIETHLQDQVEALTSKLENAHAS